jgi:uncharacterized protein (TIGR02246 family)
MTSSSSPACAYSTAKALAPVHAWIAALNRNDLNGVVAPFAGDASFFGTRTQTLINSSEGIRKYFDLVFEKYAPLSVALGQVTVSELSPDSAVITGYDQWTVTIDGRPAEDIGRLSMVIARRDDQWRIVSFHRSAMPN